jgi:hypothetical protein
VALVGLVAACGSQSDADAKRFKPGLVSSADHARSAAAAGRLGAKVVRVEFDIGTRPAAMRRTIDALRKRGVRPLLLAGFHGRMPTRAEAANLGSWATAFAKGRLAVRLIEFGNETSYRDQYGDTFSDESYRERAALYAVRFRQAHRAVANRVGLLAQADDGGTASPVWVNSMFDAVPNLDRLVVGWTVHPYGPRDRWQPKLRRLIRQTAANGAPSTIPIDVTEYGISSDDGAPLSDNYGWPVDQTYEQAADALRETVDGMRGDDAVARRLRLFLVYAAHDLGRHGSGGDREQFFGALRHNLSPKGAYTAEVRSLFHDRG